jgi:hypothetical protein
MKSQPFMDWGGPQWLTTPALETHTLAIPPPSTTPLWTRLECAEWCRWPDNAGTDGVGYGFDHLVFWIDRYHPHSVKQHTAFAAKTRTEVDAFHAAALKVGGAENGAPGLRRANCYAAFVVDPDGNNIEAVFRGALADWVIK